MQFHCISLFLAVILFISCVQTKKNANEEILQILNCVSTSENQEVCDQFLGCNDKLAKPYRDAYNECIKIFLENDVGRCDENSELYQSERMRRQINWCMHFKVAGKELTNEERQEMGVFQQCVHNLGEDAGCNSGCKK